MKLKIEIYNINRKFIIDPNRVKKFARLIFKNEKHERVDVNVVFVDNDYIIELNKTYLNSSEATDVLSFSLGHDAATIEGEIYINLDVVTQNTDIYDVTFEQEVLRMVAHGILHLLDYDDCDDESRKTMSSKEDYYLSMYH